MWTPKNESSITQSNVLRFMVLEIICIVLMVLDFSAKIAAPIRAAVSTLTYPLVKLIELPQTAYTFINSTVSNQRLLLDENYSLKQKFSQAQIDLLQLETISQENIELRQLLKAKQQLPLKTTGAFLININSGVLDDTFVINQGFKQGVFVGQTILALNGLAGQVKSVDIQSSHVILISNKNHAVPIEFLRTGIRTFAYGTGEFKQLSLPEIPQSADVKIGDVLITSGYGDVFPRGLKVAIINKLIDSEDRSYKQALATPSAALDNIKQVLLVWSGRK